MADSGHILLADFGACAILEREAAAPGLATALHPNEDCSNHSSGSFSSVPGSSLRRVSISAFLPMPHTFLHKPGLWGGKAPITMQQVEVKQHTSELARCCIAVRRAMPQACRAAQEDMRMGPPLFTHLRL